MKKEDPIKKELEELAPGLSGQLPEDKQGFGLPANYFQDLQDQVIGELGLDKGPAPVATRRSWLDELLDRWSVLWQPRVALALASIILLLGLGVWFLVSQGMEEPTLAEEAPYYDFSEEEALALLEENLDEYELETLIQLVSDDRAAIESIKAESQDPALKKELEDQLQDMDLEEIEDLL